MARSFLLKQLLVVCLAFQAGQFPSAWADSQAGVSMYARDDYSSAIASDLRLLAFQGDPQAQTQLAHLYADGRGVPQNYGEAIDWYRRAALQGYQPATEALESLGVSLISEQMTSNEASQASDGSSPQASNADAQPEQNSHGGNIVTINIVTGVAAPHERQVIGAGSLHSAILLPRNRFKASRHSRHRQVISKPGFRIGKSALPVHAGKHQKSPHMGTGHANSHARGVGRIPTR